MESFLYSTALGFIVYQLIAYLRPAAVEQLVQNIGHRLGPRAVVWARRGLFAALSILVLYLLLVLHWPLRVDTSRTRVNLISGFFCGPLLAIWVNSVLNSPAEKGLSKGQIVGFCGLAALAVVGSIGDDGAKILRHYARNISSVSIAGAALQFSANNRRNAKPGSASTPPPGSTGKSVASSQGLQYASNLGAWFIKNDIDYLDPVDLQAAKALASSRIFAENVIQPPLACLFAWQQAGTDPVSVGRHLRAFAEVFRYLHFLDEEAYRTKFADEFARQVHSLVTEVVLRPPPKDNPCDKLTDNLSADEVKKQIELLPKSEYRERPYLAIAYASLLAQLDHYAAATAILANWLDTFLPVDASPSAVRQASSLTANDWLEIRARSILAAYMEEWITGDEGNITTPMRDEHLANMEIVLSKLKASLDGSDLLKTVDSSSVRFVEPGSCRHSEREIRRKLFTSYINIDLTYWQNTFLHPAYKENFVKQTSDGLDTLVRTDVSCVRGDPNPKLLYAQILAAYVHNAILYTDAIGKDEDEDKKADRLANALAAAQLGKELAKRATSNGKHGDANYLNRIAPSDATATWEALQTDANYLEKLKEE